MVRAFRFYTHKLKIEAYFTPDIFALVLGCNIHISGVVIRNFCRFALVITLEEIKLHFGSEEEVDTFLFGIRNRTFQDRTAIGFKRRTVRIGNIAEHTHDSAVVRTPRQHRQR